MLSDKSKLQNDKHSVMPFYFWKIKWYHIFYSIMFLVELCVHTKQAWMMCTKLMAEGPFGDWGGIIGFGFKLQALICKKERMNVLLIYLSDLKNIYTL